MRYYGTTNEYEIILTNENYNTSNSFNLVKTPIQIQNNKNQLQIPITEEYNEGDEYSFKVLDNSSNILHRGKIYFTDE